MSKLKNHQVKEIRRRWAEGGVTRLDLAADYDVSPGTISPILSGRTWKHLLPSVDSADRIEEGAPHGGAQQAPAA